MAEASGKDIDRLSELFQQGGRLVDAAALAGTAVAAPLVGLRERQAVLEAARTEKRLGPAHPETEARRSEAARLAERGALWRDDLARQTLPRPDLGEQAGLYGRVTRDGKPLAGLMVSALDAQGNLVAHSCTGLDGDYSLAFTADRPVQIELREERKPIFRDESGKPYPGYRATHRDLELSKARPPCPDDEPRIDDPKGGGTEVPAPPAQPEPTNSAPVEPAPPPDDTKPPIVTAVTVPNLVGMPVSRALEALKALGLRLGQRKIKPGRQADIILDQDPVAGKVVERGTPIDLVISVVDANAAPNIDVTGRTLNQAVAAIADAGTAIGTVTVSRDGPRTPVVTETTPDISDNVVHLAVSTAGGDAKMMEVAATVIAQTPEAAAAEVENKAAAADLLKTGAIASLSDLNAAAALDDKGLRDRLKLKADADTAPLRRLLLTAAAKIREA